ncbi:MAG: glycosyltransferase [Kiritimatiellia bacterium]
MKTVTAVILTFNNVDMLASLLRRIASQTRPPDGTIVIDNASADKTGAIIRNEFPGVRHVQLPENTGSGGYQEGLKIASETGDLVWTLDDDVMPEKNALEKLVRGMARLEKSRQVAAVRSVGSRHPEDEPTELEIVPWRGTLIKCGAIKEVGLPRKDFFLYGDDLEYSLRLRQHGYSFFWIPSSKCAEGRSSKKQDTIVGKRVSLYRAPFRLYYAFRNEISIYLTYRLYLRFVRTFAYAIKVSFYILVTERLRGLPKLRALTAGLRDGLRGKLGRNLNYLPHADGIES